MLYCEKVSLLDIDLQLTTSYMYVRYAFDKNLGHATNFIMVYIPLNTFCGKKLLPD